jgi:hypothetical protein
VAKAGIRQSVRELPGFGEPVGRELLQGFADRRVDVERDRLPDGRRGHRVPLDDLAEHRLRGAARVGGLADQHLVQHTGQGEGVARRTHDLIAGRLLRRHVVRGSDAQAGLREAIPSGGPHRERDPEVRDQRLASAQEDVGRLDVPVDDPLLVGGLERVRDGRGDADRLAHGKLPLPVELVAQGLPFDVGHHVEEERVRFSGIE